MTFWEHLDVLRTIMVHSIAAFLLCAALAFFLKEWVFDILLSPSHSDFFIYQAICEISQLFGKEIYCDESFDIKFINIELTSQFMAHIKVSLMIGFLLSTPYIIYQLLNFVIPALHTGEKKIAIIFCSCGLILFFIGVLLNYYIIFPFSLRFLYNYQVHSDITNNISISSYIEAFLVLSLFLGVTFEVPLLIYLLSLMGLIESDTLIRYRKHVFVVILIIAAIITPTADIFTLLIVAIPIYILYEASILIVRRKQKRD